MSVEPDVTGPAPLGAEMPEGVRFVGAVHGPPRGSSRSAPSLSLAASTGSNSTIR